jgi:riboflavin synthase
MFTGIIEAISTLLKKDTEGSNVHFTFVKPANWALNIDESVSHSGVCLTVVALIDNSYTVTAVNETLVKTNLATWEVGTVVNLERAMIAGTRLNGHIVQGHVDTIGKVLKVEQIDGSWLFRFQYPEAYLHLMVEKGSVCINGVSLTVFGLIENQFSVTIIPYTWQHTQFQYLAEGDSVNLEFDILGKYVARLMEVRTKS